MITALICGINIKTYNGLTEIFLHCGISQAGQVHSVEVVLVPEVDLINLFHVESLVLEGGNVEISARREHFSA